STRKRCWKEAGSIMGESNVWSYVIAAYAVTWIGLIGYTVRLYVSTRRAKETATELGDQL
ncbi:MAG: hypothetical protein ACOCUW_00115, partial [Gemmatimonadota bacterium]